MKVESLLTNTTQPAPNSPASKQASFPDLKRSQVSSSSSVEISQCLLKINSESYYKSTFNAEKVSHIKTAIAEGRFEINSGAIADKLIATAHELLETQSSKE